MNFMAVGDRKNNRRLIIARHSERSFGHARNKYARIPGMQKLWPLSFIIAALGLSGCDQITAKLGLEDPAAKEARLESEGKAVGSACRHSGRAIEDCYAIYTWVPKSAVYTGWREMDEYMRENKIDTIVPQLPPPEPPPSPSSKKKKKTAAPTEGEGEAKEDKDAVAGEGKAEPAEKH